MEVFLRRMWSTDIPTKGEILFKQVQPQSVEKS